MSFYVSLSSSASHPLTKLSCSSLGDFKRAAIREGLSLKLGALLELSEKTTIIAELGKLMVDELPTQRTQPGALRAHYDGTATLEFCLRGLRN